MASKQEFIFALLATFEALGKPEPSKAALDIWCSAIETAGLSWGDACGALAKFIGTPGSGKFAPTPADIVEQIKGTAKDIKNDLEARALSEWGRVIKAIGAVGAYKSVVFDDGRTMCAVQSCGGWQAICAADQDTLNVMQAQFRRGYVGADRDRVPAVLAGLHHNQPNVRVHFLGDVKKCQRILEAGKRGLDVSQGAETTALPAPKTMGQILQLATVNKGS